ncbi:MAG: TldD/PmbA family protein, partial [Candidatus Bathyarchaeia archaeon]
LGASEVETHYSITRNVEVKIESNEISDASLRLNRSLHIAVVLGRKLGFSRTTDVSDKGVEDAVEKAYRLASSSNENPLWKQLPSPKPFPPVKGTFDDRISSFEPDGVVKLAKEMLSEARRDPRVSVPGGSASLTQGETHVANSRGILGSDKGTGITMELMTLAKDNGEVGSFAFTWEASRKLDLDPAEIGREAAVKAVESLHAKKIESFRGALLLDYDVSVDFVSALSEALNGDMVWRGSSPLKDKISQDVAVRSFSMVDDGTLEAGVSTSMFDYEGVPRMRTILIDKGVLKSFLHNTYTSGILGVETTGNTSGFLSVAPSNIVVSSGDWNIEEMTKNIKHGLMIKRFSGHIRPEDGVVSGSVKQAFLIENGEIKHPVKECMISGNLYKFFKGITGVGNVLKRRGSVITPRIMIENVSVIG